MNHQEQNNLIEKKENTNLDNIMESLPEVQAGKNLWQNRFHEFDVYGHTIKFVEHLKEILKQGDGNFDPNLIAAAWLHDIGKPITAKARERNGIFEEREPGKPYHEFPDHEIIGAEMVKKMDSSFFEKLGLNQEKVASLVNCHFIPMKGIKDMRQTKNWQEFLEKYYNLKKKLEDMNNSKNMEPVSKEEVLLMFLADKLAQGDPEKFVTDREELFSIREALLSSDQSQERSVLEKIYQLQKEEALAGKQYAAKE
jgi:putative nucleotidyltransferase with HDIG domain